MAFCGGVEMQNDQELCHCSNNSGGNCMFISFIHNHSPLCWFQEPSVLGIPIQCFSFNIKASSTDDVHVRHVFKHCSSVCGMKSRVRGLQDEAGVLCAIHSDAWVQKNVDCAISYQWNWWYPLIVSPLHSSHRVIGFQSPWQLSCPFQPMAMGHWMCVSSKPYRSRSEMFRSN